MPQCEVDLVIERPREEVFDYVADRLFATYPAWADDVETMHPVGDAVTVHGTTGRLVRIVPGGLIELAVIVTAYQPPGGFAFRAERRAVHLASTFGFEPVGESTRLRYQREMAMPGINGARLRLGSQKRQMAGELRRLRALLGADR